ncbi:MAG: glycosyltransferase family 4 protein [Clostridiaceae bacterium]|nr:glycosyltransferase family 4 protein [Clostridiaceae bacterium]
MHQNKSEYILAFSHSNYLLKCTGTEKAMREIAFQFQKNNIHYIQVFSFYNSYLSSKTSTYLGINIDDQFYGIVEWKNLQGVLNDIERKRNIKLNSIQIHHLLHHKLEKVEEFLKQVNVPIYFFVHDYYTVCKSITLIDSNGKNCGASFPCEKKCSNCSYYPAASVVLNSMLKFMDNLLIKIKRVIVPSENVKKNWGKLYPQYIEKIIVRPHLCLEGVYQRSPIINRNIRIGFAGAQLKTKGYDTWKRLCETILKNGSPYDLFYFGTGSEKLDNVNNISVNVLKGSNSMVEALREKEIDILLLWNPWLETYSYVYYEACQAGCFIITNKQSGNIYEETSFYNNGIILDGETALFNTVKDESTLRNIIQKYQENPTYSPEKSYPNTDISAFYEPLLEAHNEKNSVCIGYRNIVLTLIYLIKFKLRKGK